MSFDGVYNISLVIDGSTNFVTASDQGPILTEDSPGETKQWRIQPINVSPLNGYQIQYEGSGSYLVPQDDTSITYSTSDPYAWNIIANATDSNSIQSSSGSSWAPNNQNAPPVVQSVILVGIGQGGTGWQIV